MHIQYMNFLTTATGKCPRSIIPGQQNGRTNENRKTVCPSPSSFHDTVKGLLHRVPYCLSSRLYSNPDTDGRDDLPILIELFFPYSTSFHPSNLSTLHSFHSTSVADPDPVPFWPLDPGWVFSGSRISDPRSQDHILKSFLTIFLVKSSIILWKLAQIFFFSTSKLK